jgi:hypothetical protein
MVAAVVTFLLVTLGPILTFRAVRSSGDYLVEDLQSAALASGIVMVIAAAWTLGIELFLSGRFGSRSGLYDSFVVALFAPWSLAGIAMVLFRAVEQGMYGAVPLGLGLQVTASAAFVATFIIARAHRSETARPERATSTATPERGRLRLERDVHRDVERVLSRADAADLNDAAVAIGMGELVRRGILSENRAAAMLRPM